MDFGMLLESFWELKLHQIDEILDAVSDAKKEVPPHFWGQPGGMRRGPGEDNGGVQGCQNCRRDEDQAKELQGPV